MNFLYLSASNIVGMPSENSTSYKICEIAKNIAQSKYPEASHSILELKRHHIAPCCGCGKCWDSHRCVANDDFNAIYEQTIGSDFLLIVSPHYAPIPAKLAALLEKMEQITFLHWGADTTYKSEVFGKPTGVISHGGGGTDGALNCYKRMVNDTIANALDTIQLRLIPYDDVWDTGIALPLSKATFSDASVFPAQEYDWDALTLRIAAYMDLLLQSL